MENDNELINNWYASQGGKPALEADLSFYESDWNMLMPVVEKIGDLYTTHPGRVSDFMRQSIGTHIQEVYKEAVAFIKWYNTQN